MSISRVNDALSCSETIDPSDVDHIAAVMRMHADSLLIDESVRHSSSPFLGISRCRDRTSRGVQTLLWDIASGLQAAGLLTPPLRSRSCGTLLLLARSFTGTSLSPSVRRQPSWPLTGLGLA